jgi:hypothetical protein|tara:strand:+ start:238 stop:396 length:159 start_codon:yes stop_codon:yes gene_type:complete
MGLLKNIKDRDSALKDLGYEKEWMKPKPKQKKHGWGWGKKPDELNEHSDRHW